LQAIEVAAGQLVIGTLPFLVFLFRVFRLFRGSSDCQVEKIRIVEDATISENGLM